MTEEDELILDKLKNLSFIKLRLIIILEGIKYLHLKDEIIKNYVDDLEEAIIFVSQEKKELEESLWNPLSPSTQCNTWPS